MTGDPLDRKPSTSSGALPPTDTVAPKSSWSDAELCFGFRMCRAKIPHDGSGTRSGSALAGGFCRPGTAGAEASGRPRGWPGARLCRRLSGRAAAAAAAGAAGAAAGWPQHPDPLTTFTRTVAVALAAGMPSSFV
jgi:hypothetical protein